MPLFVDTHSLGGYSRADLERSITEDADEFGVKIHQILFNKDKDIIYCICEAPTKDAVINHHKKFDCICDSIIETDQIKTTESLKAEKLQTIGELAARIAHDLRNPLAVIKGSIEILKIKNPETYQRSIQDFERMEKSVIRIMHQVDNVLDFVRPKPLHFETTKVSKIAYESISKSNVPDGVTISTHDLDFDIMCDAEKIEIIFVNLIANAIQAMNENGRIDIRAVDDGQHVVIEVEDSGPGIPDHLLPRIFEPLFTTRQVGTGLGLPSCKTIAEQHGGSINVRTVLGKGTIFVIKLPKS